MSQRTQPKHLGVSPLTHNWNLSGQNTSFHRKEQVLVIRAGSSLSALFWNLCARPNRSQQALDQCQNTSLFTFSLNASSESHTNHTCIMSGVTSLQTHNEWITNKR